MYLPIKITRIIRKELSRGDVYMLGKDYFMKVYDEEVGSLEQVNEDTPAVDDKKVDEPGKEVPVVTPNAEDSKDVPPVVEKPKSDVFTIDGEEVSLDVIKEWKQGNMRQSDYTRKTQELAKQKKELEELKAKSPEDLDDYTEKSPELKRIEKIELDLASKQLDLEISTLKQKYPDFNEVKVLQECDKRGIYNDLEFVYKALRDSSTDKPKDVDVEALKKQAIDEYKATIAQELAKDKEATSGSIITSAPGTPETDYSDLLTSEEKEFCARRGWSHEDYAKLKDAQYKL